MIIPLRTSNGGADLARMGEWIAVCDRCGARSRLGADSFEASWFMAQRRIGGVLTRVYCPRCIDALAAALIGRAMGPAWPARLARAVVPDRLADAMVGLAVVAVACVAALLPRPLSVPLARRAAEVRRPSVVRAFRRGGGA